MKFITIVVLALIAVVSCDPIQISDNNVGDIITVGISAKADISYNVDLDIVNVIVALLNQNAEVSRSDVPLAEAEVSDLTVGESEIVDFVETPVETFAIGDSPRAQYLEAPVELYLIGDSPPAQYLEVPTEINLIGDSPPIETLDESEGVISQEAFNHFVRVLPSGFQF